MEELLCEETDSRTIFVLKLTWNHETGRGGFEKIKNDF
jgi:hypothetical protein